MDTLPSDALRKLSRNVKAVAAVALLYYAFIKEFGPSLTILDNDIPAQAIPVAAFGLLIYNLGFLLWQWRSDLANASLKAHVEWKALLERRAAALRDIEKSVGSDIVRSVDFNTLQGRGEFADTFSEDDPSTPMLVMHMVQELGLIDTQIMLDETATRSNKRLTLIGHVVIPCLLALAAAVAAFNPDTVSWIGSSFGSEGTGVAE